jgi:carbonic anhydrase
VQVLKVKYIIVMGHSRCGGVRAFVQHRDRPDPGDFIDNWMSLIAPAANSLESRDELAPSEYLTRLEQASVVATLGNLMTFPWIRSRAESLQLHLLGAYFDVATGVLAVRDSITGVFKPVVDTIP